MPENKICNLHNARVKKLTSIFPLSGRKIRKKHFLRKKIPNLQGNTDMLASKHIFKDSQRPSIFQVSVYVFLWTRFDSYLELLNLTYFSIFTYIYIHFSIFTNYPIKLLNHQQLSMIVLCYNQGLFFAHQSEKTPFL